MGFLDRLFGGKNNTIKSPSVSETHVYPNPTKADFFLDCKNLNCPMPIVKISKQFKTMQIGQTLEVVATDPAFKADLEAWIRSTGNELIVFEEIPIRKAFIKKITQL